jgi:tetratricopeptide (TPR) repeat protein
MVGYHLEQARRFVVEIGGDPELAADLADRAGHRLGAAGTRASARGDARASVLLLARAVELIGHDADERPRLLEELADSQLVAGELEAAAATLEALGLAVSAETPLGSWAGLRRDEIAFLADPRATSIGELRGRATEVASALERAGDPAHLASALAFLAELAWLDGSAGEMVTTADRALALGRAAANRRTVAVAAGYVGRGLQLGPTPCEEALARLSDLMALLDEDQVARAACGLERALTLAMLGRADEADADLAASTAVLEELGQRRWLAQATGVAGLVRWSAGDAEAAESRLRAGYAFFHGQGDLANATPAACDLAHVLADLGRFDEVAHLADEVALTAGEYDLEPQIGWRTARARALAHRGDPVAAERLVDEAVALAAGTDFLDVQGDTHRYRAEVLFSAGRVDDAREAIGTAVERYARKGDLAEHAATARLAEAWGRTADGGRAG